MARDNNETPITLPANELNAYKKLAAVSIYLSAMAGIMKEDTKAEVWAKTLLPTDGDAPAITINKATNVLFGEDTVFDHDPATGKPAEQSIIDDVDPAQRGSSHNFDVVNG